ncbi:MAG: hypothetical protein IH948_09035 [Bacteroidetes bacterium]|nr:hypothetical protein [Bacteroidota bacterium]
MKALLVLIGIGLSLQLDAQEIIGIPPSEENCNIYLENNWWLPESYVANAICACTITPDEPRANVIRKSSIDQMLATNEDLKKEAQKKKDLFEAEKISKKEYKKYVIDHLLPLILNHHVEAYELGGCKGDPVPKWAWKIVLTKKIKNCKRVWFDIRCFGGSCNKKFCKW